MPSQTTKTEHNKKYYEAHSPYPVRLGILDDIIRDKAAESDQSKHWIIVDALEKCFWEDVKELAKKVSSTYNNVKRLIQQDLTLKEAITELRINEKLFIIGLTDEQARELVSLLCPKEADKFKQKRGYYNYVGEHNKACEPPVFKVFRGPKKKFSANDRQLAFFY